MPFNCRACGGQHDNMKELQDCHQNKKKASDTPPEPVQEPTEGPEKGMYRKKPVVIEAYKTDKQVKIKTLEGTMTAEPGDWIITGVEGEQYPCKPAIFNKTYEPVDDMAIPVVQVGDKGKFIIGREHMPEIIKYMSTGQYMALKLLGHLREAGLVVEELEVQR